GRPARDDRAPPRRDDRGPGDRGPRPEGGTVRYSALAPRPAGPRDGPRGPGAPRGPRIAPNAPPATPEIQRATRQAPRPGGTVMDRRDEDERRAGPSKAISRAKGAPTRREG